MLAPMYISFRNIFAPPKGVTSAFEKKHLVGKAKVVSATDVNDRDVWNGAKRVSMTSCALTLTLTQMFAKIKLFFF